MQIRQAPAAGVGRLCSAGLPGNGPGSSLLQKPFHLQPPSPQSCPLTPSHPAKRADLPVTVATGMDAGMERRDRWGAACPRVLSSWARAVGSTTGSGMQFLWALWCTAPSGQSCTLTSLPSGISLFWDALCILSKTDGTTCCLGCTDSTG